jgi:hypothetical protein
MTITLKSEMREVPIETKQVSDFDNTKDGPTVLVIQGGFGSIIDTEEYVFDLDNEMTEKVLNFIKQNLPKDKKIDDFKLTFPY